MNVFKQIELDKILEKLYSHKFNDKDFAMVIRRIYQSLNDNFIDEAPTVKQQKKLDDLLKIADQIEMFFKERE